MQTSQREKDMYQTHIVTCKLKYFKVIRVFPLCFVAFVSFVIIKNNTNNEKYIKNNWGVTSEFDGKTELSDLFYILRFQTYQHNLI